MIAASENVRLASRKVERVLLEYEGPQLVVLRDGEQRYVGYVADELEDGRRWIQVPVTNLEIKALHRGKLTLREVLEKTELVICDTSPSGETLRLWLAPPASIPEDCLPDHGVELPEFARDPAYQAEPDRLAFECEGAAVGHGTITFDCLASVTGALQRLWFAIARQLGIEIDRTSGWNDATLAFAAGRKGSFAIEIDERGGDKFEAIAQRYKRLVHTSYVDPQSLHAQLAQASDLSLAYGLYAEALEQYGIDVLANWKSDAVFLGNDRAKRVAKAYGRRTRRAPRLIAGPADVVTINVDGYFDGLMRRRHRFDFVDPRSDTDYGGEIDREAVRHLQEMDIVLGRHAYYRATIEVTTEPEGAPGKSKHVLLAVKELARQLKI
jgi:hypothetical protein